MPDSGDWESPFHDSEVEALEQAIRDHPARGFQRPRWTTACPGCGRHVLAAMLEEAHYAPGSKPLCGSCRKNWAKWHREPSQIAQARRDREKRRELGLKPTVHGSPE